QSPASALTSRPANDIAPATANTDRREIAAPPPRAAETSAAQTPPQSSSRARSSATDAAQTPESQYSSSFIVIDPTNRPTKRQPLVALDILYISLCSGSVVTSGKQYPSTKTARPIHPKLDPTARRLY